MRVSIVGAGNLGKALATGFINSNFTSFNMSRRDVSKLESFTAKGIEIFDDNNKAIRDSNVVILCVEPNHIVEVTHTLDLQKEQHLVSCAPGVPLTSLKKVFSNVSRAIPNTAVLANKGVIVINKESPTDVETVFSFLGKVYRLEERLLDAGTILGACGVAFTMKYMRAMSQAGISIGIDGKTSLEMSRDLLEGTAELVKGSHPELEIDRVTTPNGCTIKGLNEMENKGFSSSIIQGVERSYSKFLR